MSKRTRWQFSLAQKADWLRKHHVEKVLQQFEAEVATLRARLERKEHVIAELSQEPIDAMKEAGLLSAGRWGGPDLRDLVVDFLRSLQRRTELPQPHLVA